MKKFALIMLLPFLLGTSFAHSNELSPAGEDHPGGYWQGIAPVPAQRTAPAAWSLRTGFRKGVQDQTLPEELLAGPDVAVLKNGSSAEWPGLLAEFREASVMTEPGSAADMSRHKPVLIIPSGGLSGLASSVFFRAGLAEYVRSGGVVLCFSQRRGADLAALPLPDGPNRTLTGKGWAEDFGPLYRSSSVQARHPALAGTLKLTPSLATDGYLLSYPAESTVLLARRDGFPTLLMYPVGRGWVVVTTLLSELSHARRLLHNEERTLVQNLLFWAKAGGKVASLAPGAQASFALKVRGPEEGAAKAVQVRVPGTGKEPLDERLILLAVAAGKEASFAYAFTVPQNAGPGIYHAEYSLMDERNRSLNFPAESGEGWFAVLSSSPVEPAGAPRSQPLPPAPISIAVSPRMTRAGGQISLNLDITRTSGSAGPLDLVARTGGMEKYFVLSGDRATVSFDGITAAPDSRLTTYAISLVEGRCLAQGGLDDSLVRSKNLAADRSIYAPGETAQVSITAAGLGALTINGLGTAVYEHIHNDRSYKVPVPHGLPEGLYPIEWEFETRTGEHRNGRLQVSVKGLKVRCTGSEWKASPDGGSLELKLTASDRTDVIVRATILDPAGKGSGPVSAAASLAPGTTPLSIAVPFKPSLAGIWQLRYEVLVPLPEGPGFPSEPMQAAGGSLFLDSGSSAILSLGTDRPVFYEPKGTVTIIASAAALSPVKLELLLDGKRVKKEKLEAGTTTVSYKTDGLSLGPHRISALVTGDGPESRREAAFLFGAHLPDLAVSIETSELKAPALEVGVGVKNIGKSAAGTAKGSLYDGDPAKGGALIGTFTVPALDPSKQHVVVLPWPLGGKAGKRTLTAIVEQERSAPETTTENNRSELQIEIPDVLLGIMPQKKEFSADEEISYRIAVANFTPRPLLLLTLGLQVADSSGALVLQESVPFKDLASGGIAEITRGLGPGVPKEGVYLITAQVASDHQLASDSAGIGILPTLAAKGSLEGTPAIAAPCRPLDIRYAVRNIGNLQITGGSLKLEVRSKALGQLVNAIQLPFALGEQTHRISKTDFPRGNYVVTLQASIVNQPSGQNTNLLLDERPLTVGDPLELQFAPAALPRLLIWAGGETETSIERALSEKMLREAFGDEGYYSTFVSSAEAFSREALSGRYNIYILIDIDSTLDTAEVLRTALSRGQSVILAGSNERTRSLAEQFFFRFEPLGESSYLTFPAGSPLRLGGNIPFAGQGFSASRPGSQVLAVFANDRPAILSANEASGKIVVLPVSLVRSALAAGTSTFYGLLLRSTVLAVAPEREENATVAAVQMTLRAKAEPMQARIITRMPEGARLLWSNRDHTIRNGELRFELTADRSGQRIVYLLQTEKPDARKPAVDVQYECNGAFISQGKAE